MASLVDFYKSKLAGVGQKLTNILDRDKETPGFQLTKNPVLFSRSTAEGGYKPSLALQAAGGLQNFAENKLPNLGRFDFMQPVNRIKNPVARGIVSLPVGLVQGFANAPLDVVAGSTTLGREIGKGFDPTRKGNFQQALAGGARMGEGLLNAYTGGNAPSAINNLTKNTFLNSIKTGAKAGAGYGAAGGLLTGLQDTSGSLGNQLGQGLKQAALGAPVGAVAGGVLGAGGYGLGKVMESSAAKALAAKVAKEEFFSKEIPRFLKQADPVRLERAANTFFDTHNTSLYDLKKPLNSRDVSVINAALTPEGQNSNAIAQDLTNIFKSKLNKSKDSNFGVSTMARELKYHADKSGIKPGFARLDLGVDTPKLSVEPMGGIKYKAENISDKKLFKDRLVETPDSYGNDFIQIRGKNNTGISSASPKVKIGLDQIQNAKDANIKVSPVSHGDWDFGDGKGKLVVFDTGVSIQKQYFDRIRKEFPNAEFFVDGKYKTSPVVAKENNQVVGVIMPIMEPKTKNNIDFSSYSKPQSKPLSVEPVGGKPVAQGGVENVGGYKKLGDWRELPLPDGFENQYKNIKTGEVKHISELPKNIQSKLGVAQGGVYDGPEQLRPLARNVVWGKMTREQFLSEFNKGIKEKNPNALNMLTEIKNARMTPESFYNKYGSSVSRIVELEKKMSRSTGNPQQYESYRKEWDALKSIYNRTPEEMKVAQQALDESLSPSKGGVGDVTRVEPKIVKPLKEVYKEKLAGQIDQKPIVQRPTGQLATQIPSELSLRQPSLPSQTTQSLLRTTQPPQPPQPPKLQMGSQQMSGTPEAKIDQWKYSSLDKLYTEGIDRFNPLSKIAKLAGKDKDMARQLARYYGTGSIADYHLTEELSPILRSVDINDLKKSAIAMRDVELASRGVKGSPEQMKAQFNLQDLTNKLGSEKMAQIGDALKKLYAYQDSMVKQYLVDTGIMSRESYDAMRKNNQFYVPFKRVMDDVDEMLGIPVKRGAGSVGSQNVIFGIKGSNKDIVDPIQSIVENTYKLVSLGERQKTARVIVNLGEQLPGLVKRVTTGDQKNTIGLFENGEKVFYEVPEEVADAARGMSEESLNTLIKILKLPTDVFRTMTTGANPEFLMPNVARDLQTAFFNAGVNPLEWIAGIAHYVKGDQVYKDFLRSGGRTSIISANKKAIIRTAEDLASKGSFTIKSPADLWKGFEILGQFSEQPTRIASFKKIYDKAIKSGLSPEEALQDAAIAAQDTTINFARRGSKTQSINAVYAYLNARMQGVDKMFRTIKNEPGKAAARFGIGLLAPSLALYAWNNRFQSYYDPSVVSDRDKTDNFIFMLSDKRGGMQYLKIPKAEVGKIVNPVEEFLDFARGKDANMANSIKSLLTSFLPVDYIGGLVPTAIQPPLENAINKDLYTGYDLVPQYKQNYPKGYQDSPYTSPVYRMIGQKTGQSPAKLQNLVEGYLGGMSKGAEMITRPIVPQKYVSPKNEQGADINKTFILRRFAGGEKKSAEEQIKSNQSKKDAIESQINVIRKQKMLGNFDASVADKEIAKLERQLPKIVTTISGKSNYYYIDSNQDMKTVDIGKVTSMPSSTNYERALKETEKWKLVDDVLNLDPQDQASALKDLGVTKEDAAYYKVASADSSAKYAYVKDQAQGASNYQEFLTKTLPLFKEVNGKKVFTDTVVDQLYDEGIITSAQKKQLKSIDYSGAKPKLKSGTTKAKYVKAVLPKSTLSSLPKVKRIRTKRYKLVVPKAK